MSDDERTTNPSKTVVTVITSAPKGTTGEQGLHNACLVVIYGDDLGRRVSIGKDGAIIGRSSKCDVQVDQESVSRNHAKITFSGTKYMIQDMGSTNGTYVNDELIDNVMLRDGDQIKVGRTIFKFITGGNIEAQYHEEIYRLMTIDGLTEVYNKRFFQEALEKEVSRCRRYDRTFSLVMFDIDHFKSINDTYGHLAGDSVLRQLGQHVRSRLRRDDVVARIGGEEFALLLPEVKTAGAVELAKKLRQLIEKSSFPFESTQIKATVSFGVAQWNPELRDGSEIVKIADEKLYAAKRAGRNCVKY